MARSLAALGLCAAFLAGPASAQALPPDADGFWSDSQWSEVAMEALVGSALPAWAPAVVQACAEPGFTCAMGVWVYTNWQLERTEVLAFGAPFSCAVGSGCNVYVFRAEAPRTLTGTDLSNPAHVGQAILAVLLVALGLHGWTVGSRP